MTDDVMIRADDEVRTASPPARRTSGMPGWVWSIIRGVTTLLAACALWEAVRIGFDFDPVTMPSVFDIGAYFFSHTSQGQLFLWFLVENMLVTAKGAVLGLLLGVTTGIVVGILIAQSRYIRSALLPLVVAAQTVPIVAIAPAVVLFMGTGTASKTVVAGFLTFFPMAVTTARGLQSVPVDSVNLLRTYNASTLSVLGGVKLPFALPLIFVGLETSAAFSVVGAIVAELPFGSKDGLGVIILSSWQFYTIQPESLYCTVIATCVLGAIIVGLIRLAARLIPAARQPHR
jgi:NitT/TauT family transport system permease protein